MAPENFGDDGLALTVRRHEPELIPPAGPTPHEFKRLSDIDDQEGFRFQIPLLFFYPYKPGLEGTDPVKAIRDGLARALVYYYPFAGRLREWEGRKLVVECTGEGVLFIEADADVGLEHFGDPIRPPFPGLDELIFDVPGSGGILGTPLLLIQVTRLRCGSFVLAVRFNHTMCDAAGMVQFLNAVAEMARGAGSPSVLPVWKRELLDARDPPRATFTHHEYDEVPFNELGSTLPPLEERTFFFGRAELAAIRNSLPHPLRTSRATTFEVLTACVWRCRTVALQPKPEDQVRMCPIVNARGRFKRPLPEGFYGNAFAYPAAMTSAGELCCNPLGYALELVRAAKAEMTEEYLQSVADLMVTKGRPGYTVPGTYVISDITRVGIDKIDFGWGNAVFAGPPSGGLGPVPGLINWFIPGRNREGEEGILLPMCFPVPAMARFARALENILQGHNAFDRPEKPLLLSTF